MKKRNGPVLSRREFAQHAAMLSATASIVPHASMLDLPANTFVGEQAEAAGPKLSPEGQAEAGARYEQVFRLYGDRLTDGQKARVKKMCAELQPILERIRSYKLDNGNAPALYLKPLYEREKKPHGAAVPPSTVSTGKP